MSRFGKVLTAMVTPFTSTGDLDLDEAGRLAQWLIQNGNDGLHYEDEYYEMEHSSECS